MHRLFLLLLTMATLSFITEAKEITKHIDIGVNSSTINAQSGNGFDITLGSDVVWDNGVMFSFDFNYGQATINSELLNNYGGDVKLGYKYNAIAMYGIGSGIDQSYNDVEGAGFGFGAGVEYTPLQYIGFGVDYKSYSMTGTYNDYTFEVTKAYLKIMLGV